MSLSDVIPQGPFIVGHGGALVDLTPFDRRVADSNPALAVTKGPWASHSLTVAYGASA